MARGSLREPLVLIAAWLPSNGAARLSKLAQRMSIPPLNS
jgi:hypothetical protein